MQQQKESTVLAHVHLILHELGLKPTNPDTFYTSYAILTAYQQPELLQDVSCALYPSVAEHYGEDPKVVESSVERAVCQMYHTHTDALSALFGRPIDDVPHADSFLAAVAAQL